MSRLVKVRWWAIVIVIVISGAILPVIAEAQSIDFVGMGMWRSIWDMKIQGNYAYCAFQKGLAILDISNPNSVTEVSKLFCYGAAWGIEVQGDYVYLADQETGLKIIDVTDKHNPILTSSYDTPGSAMKIFVTGNIAYIADGDSGLLILSIADHTNPAFLSRFNTGGQVQTVYVSNNYAYIGVYGVGLSTIIVDISNPSIPVLACNYNKYDTPCEIVVKGNYAYLSHGYSMEVLDISNPIMPESIGYYSNPPGTGIFLKDICVVGDYIYAANYGIEQGLAILDISNPHSPSLAANYLLPHGNMGCWTVAGQGNYAYIGNYFHSGFFSFDVTNKSAPVLLDSCYVAWEPQRIAVRGQYAYVLDRGLKVIDITNPQNPTQVGVYMPANTWGTDMAITGSYAYLASNNLEIVSISNPTHPYYLRTYPIVSDDPSIIKIATDNYARAFIYAASGKIYIVSTANPYNPTALGEITLPFTGEGEIGMAATENYLYFAWESHGLWIIDISNPAQPFIASHYITPVAGTRDVKIYGHYAFVAGPGLEILDVSDPYNPELISHSDTYAYALKLTVLNDYLYMDEAWYGVEYFDISDLAHPVSVGHFDTWGYVAEVAVQGNYAYLADAYGLVVLDAMQNCGYISGDINGDGQKLGSDVTYGVRYFKGLGAPPADSCYLDSTGAYLYPAGDVNGDCEFRGADITRLVAYFKSIATLAYCPSRPPINR
jgi:hypothetical protein